MIRFFFPEAQSFWLELPWAKEGRFTIIPQSMTVVVWLLMVQYLKKFIFGSYLLYNNLAHDAPEPLIFPIIFLVKRIVEARKAKCSSKNYFFPPKKNIKKKPLWFWHVSGAQVSDRIQIRLGRIASVQPSRIQSCGSWTKFNPFSLDLDRWNLPETNFFCPWNKSELAPRG